MAAIGKDAVTVVFLVALMFYEDWVLALASFFAFPLAIRPIVGIGRRMRRVSVNTQIEAGLISTLLSQTFQGARHVKAYGMEAYETGRANALFERMFRLIDRANRTRARASPLMEALGGSAVAVVILYGGYQVIEGSRTPGAFFTFITALLLAYQPLEEPRQPQRLAAGGAGGGATRVRGARHRAGDPRPPMARNRCASAAARSCLPKYVSAISHKRSRFTTFR